MLTDAPPRKANRAGFLESDRIKTFDLPEDGRLLVIAESIEFAMKGTRTRMSAVHEASFRFYHFPDCGVGVLAA